MFTAPEQMEAKLTSLFANLKDANFLRDLSSGPFSQKAARLLGELNEGHAFREGNGRTQRFFLEAVANQASYPLSFDVVSRERMIQASIAYSRGNSSLFERMFEEIADPARVEPLRQAIDFLAQQQFEWNEAYLATTVPGQHYSGTLAGRNADSFMMLTADRKQILIGATNDLPAADWRHVGRCALRDSQPQTAVDAFQHAATLDPSAEAYSLLGLALVRAGRLSEVTPVLRQAARADPQEDQLYRAWGAYYPAQGDLDRGASYYEKAIAMLHPEGLGLGQVDHDYSTLADIYAKQGRHRAAAEAYEEDCFAMICSASTAYRFGLELAAIGDHEKLDMLIDNATDKNEADRLRALANK